MSKFIQADKTRMNTGFSVASCGKEVSKKGVAVCYPLLLKTEILSRRYHNPVACSLPFSVIRAIRSEKAASTFPAPSRSRDGRLRT